MRKEAEDAVKQAEKHPTAENTQLAQNAIDDLLIETKEDEAFKNALQAQLDAIRDQAKPHFSHTDETRQIAELNLEPTVKTMPDQKKTAGGVLGLDIGILELGLISAEQINKISDLNRHQVTVPQGHTLDGQVEVTVRSVLGGHAFKVHILQKQKDGQYKKVQTLEESSGSFLFMGKVAKVPFETLEEGEYEFVLETGAGLSVVQVIPYHLTNLTLNDYTNVSTKESIVKGNVLKGQKAGKGGKAIVTKVNGQSIGSQQTIQGRYGQLRIDKNGEYTYTPASNPKSIGQVEVFSFDMQNVETKHSTKGSLQIRLNEPSVEWTYAPFTVPARIVEATDHTFSIDGTPVTTQREKTLLKKESQKKFENNDFTSQKFTIQDTASELVFHVLGGKGTNSVQAPIYLKDAEGNTVQVLRNVSIEEEVWNEQKFTNVPAGTYYLYIPKQEGFNGTLYVEGKNADAYEVVDHAWGTYENIHLNKMTSHFAKSPFNNFFSKEPEKAKLYVYGYAAEVTKQGKEVVSSTKGYHRVPSKGSLTIASDYGFLTVKADGTFTYEPINHLASYGQKDRVPYKIQHLSGHASEAEMIFDLFSLRNTDENDNIITSSEQSEKIVGKGGSDTLVYTVLKEDGTGGHGHDEWLDFTYGTIETNREADRIDLRQLFTLQEVEVDAKGEVIGVKPVEQKVTEDNIHTFVQVDVSNDGKKIILSIDRDGADSRYAFEEILTLHVTNPEQAKHATLKEMIQNKQLIIQ